MATTTTPIPRKQMGKADMISPKSRSVMTFSFLDGRTIREIAKDAGVRVQVVEDVLRHEWNTDPRTAPPTPRVFELRRTA